MTDDESTQEAAEAEENESLFPVGVVGVGDQERVLGAAANSAHVSVNGRMTGDRKWKIILKTSVDDASRACTIAPAAFV